MASTIAPVTIDIDVILLLHQLVQEPGRTPVPMVVTTAVQVQHTVSVWVARPQASTSVELPARLPRPEPIAGDVMHLPAPVALLHDLVTVPMVVTLRVPTHTVSVPTVE